MSRILFETNVTRLSWVDMPSPGKTTKYSPFVRIHEKDKSPAGMAWDARIFMPVKASRSSALSSLGTTCVALSRLAEETPRGLTLFDEGFRNRITAIGGDGFQAYQMLIDSLRLAFGLQDFDHGVRFKRPFVMTAPKPGINDRHHFLVMEPFGHLFTSMASGALKRTAIKFCAPGEAVDRRTFFPLSVESIMCEDKDDALTLAYSLEADEIDYELF